MTLKTPCQSCGVNIEHDDFMSGTETQCPSCNAITVLAVAASRKSAANVAASEAERVRRSAKGTMRTGHIIVVLGLLAIAAGVLISLGDTGHDAGDAATFMVIGASLIGSAFWIYLIAQIMHIRANTTRD